MTNVLPTAVTLTLVTVIVSTVESSEYFSILILPEVPLTRFWANCTIRPVVSGTLVELSLGLRKLNTVGSTAFAWQMANPTSRKIPKLRFRQKVTRAICPRRGGAIGFKLGRSGCGIGREFVIKPIIRHFSR